MTTDAEADAIVYQLDPRQHGKQAATDEAIRAAFQALNVEDLARLNHALAEVVANVSTSFAAIAAQIGMTPEALLAGIATTGDDDEPEPGERWAQIVEARRHRSTGPVDRAPSRNPFRRRAPRLPRLT